MKIVIIAARDVLSFVSGASRRVFELAKGLHSCGASVYVLHHGITKPLNDGFKFIHFKSYPLSEASNYLHPLNPLYPPQLHHFLRNYNPDIIQCEQPWSAFPTLLFAKKFRIPCVLDEHNVEFLWTIYASRVPFLAPVNFALEKLALSHSSLILATSETDKKLLMQIYKISDKKIFVVPNGVDNRRFLGVSYNKLQLKRSLGLDPTGKIVLFHGIMSARQNYEAARLIIDFIAPRVIDATFLIIGKDPPRWLKIRAKSQKNVRILGYVQNIEEYITVADICVAPIQRGSGTRLKVLEYLAARKPVIATNKAIEGLEVINEIHGLFFKDVDDHFLNGIQRVISDDELSYKLGENAGKLASKYDWSVISSKLYNLYKSLVSCKRSNNSL
ncbi:MAG: glycosyltransferase family 4 protein [Candidatus Baldrarchaeia archaeon]